MLYVTTRSEKDTFTAFRALSAETAPDGGHFVPFKLPTYSITQLKAMANGGFNQTVADILNVFFSAGLTAWDVDLTIGKSCCKLLAMNHRMLISELWRNPAGSADYIVERLYFRLCSGHEAPVKPGDWAKTATWIAVFFAIYAQAVQQEQISLGDVIDVAIPGENFLMPMAAWYARKMGLPIQTIICACDDSCSYWDIIHRGTQSTATFTAPALLGIEKLFSATLGKDSAVAFTELCAKRRSYNLDEEQLPVVSEGFFCAVAGENRCAQTINSVYRTNSYILEQKTALGISALQDYRSATGKSRLTLIVSEIDPSGALDQISNATGIGAGELKKLINN